MRRFLAIAPLLLVLPASAFAALGASATVTGSGSGAGPTFHYTATVNDTGTTTVGTFWYAWVPGRTTSSSSPTNITSPAGWTAAITHVPATASNGYAIQWVASSAASDISAGTSLSGFGFDSTDTFSQVAGNSAYYPSTPVGTSFVYSGAPFSDAGSQFVASTVAAPEPASLSLLASATLLLFRRRR